MPTEGGKNNLFRSVLPQMHIPRGLMPNIVRHQLAQFMTEQVCFFFPKMKEYLEQNKLSFNAYIMNLYKGNIWANEYIIGALGKMFNIKISIVTLYCTDVWNVFHDSTIPDVVLVANRQDFKGKNWITHFLMTKGREASWKCVGSKPNLGKIGNYRGFSNGKSLAINVYEAAEKRNSLAKSEKIAKTIDCLCDDLKSLCIQRDQLFQELNDMQVPVQQFKWFDRYFISEKVRSSINKKRLLARKLVCQPNKNQEKNQKEIKEKQQNS